MAEKTKKPKSAADPETKGKRSKPATPKTATASAKSAPPKKAAPKSRRPAAAEPALLAASEAVAAESMIAAEVVVAAAPATPKKAAPKKAAPKRASRAKPPALPDEEAAVTVAMQPQVSAEERYRLIELAAYLRSEAAGFGGDPAEHWLAAEAEVDAKLNGMD